MPSPPLTQTDHAAIAAQHPGRFVRRIDRTPRRLAEIPAAILVVAEIGVLLAGVTARYVFQVSLVWTDACLQARLMPQHARSPDLQLHP